VDITGADYARDIPLTDHNGQQRSLKDFKGKVVVVFFGYTQCPDVCPTSMAELAEVKKLLGKDGDKLQGIFVTVDPERDTPEMLKAYMANFDPSFLALSRHARAAGRRGQGLQDLLQEGRRQDPHQLHHGPLRGQLRVRPAGPPAAVQPLWQRGAGAGR
jgi:thiol-disulfide isomerase/thioredoxin